jgi:hypothetical protein
LVDPHHTPEVGTKKGLRSLVFDVASQRFLQNTLLREIYPVPEVLATASASSAGPSTPVASAADPPEDITTFPRAPSDVEPQVTKMASTPPPTESELSDIKEKISRAYRRWVEEVRASDMLNGLTWASYVPDTGIHRAGLDFINSRGMEFVRTFDNDVVRAWNLTDYPRSLRCWIAETEWVMGEMRNRGFLPRSLLHPRDKQIRGPASAGADQFLDPGNLSLEIFVYTFRLWRYCDQVGYDAAIRVSPFEYGHKANESSRGPVNLRGNIVEAMTRELQVLGSRNVWRPWNAPRPEPQGVWGGRPRSWAPGRG